MRLTFVYLLIEGWTLLQRLTMRFSLPLKHGNTKYARSAWQGFCELLCFSVSVAEEPTKRFSIIRPAPHLLICLLINSCNTQPTEIPLSAGMQIQESIQIKPAYYQLTSTDSLKPAIIAIQGNDIQMDFKGTVLDGATDNKLPNEFTGTGVLIQNSRKVTIKNLTIKGYKVALMAENVDSLEVVNCDFSYNYRQKLSSTREKEDTADWLSFPDNDLDEWLRFGTGIYLKNCNRATIKSVKITGGQNGIMMTSCNHGLFYNNQIQFNSGVGIGLYRSSHNQIMHNQLDWNLRGYSQGFYQSGQGAAGILCYEQSNHNVFAYNSVTHSSNGILCAASTTLDASENGCNNNLLYGNDFSNTLSNATDDPSEPIEIPSPLPDGMDTKLPDNHPTGKSFLLIDEWGPYNYGYPSIWLREIKRDSTYVFLLMGPQGNWKVVDGNGFHSINPKTGSFPVTLTAKKHPDSANLLLNFEFIGTAFLDQFGQDVPKGQIYPFSFHR